MARHQGSIISAVVICALTVAVKTYSDDQFDRLISSENYKDAIQYADDKLPPASRDAAIWSKLAKANDAMGMTEKALACYLVAWRMNPNDYQALVGAARVYNKLDQPDNALSMAKKALDMNFTAEASWEYARACIALNRPADAKKAMEKVIESDSSNSIANRELGNIYFNEKAYVQAIPLLKKSMKEKADGETAYRLGRCFIETGLPDDAIQYLKEAIKRQSNVGEASLALARAYYGQKNYSAAVAQYGQASGQGSMSAEDYYAMAVSNEKSGNGKVAADAYQNAVRAYGMVKSREALLAREKVGRNSLDNKAYGAALSQFQFIADADERATVVPETYFLLAECYQAMDNNSKAISSLEKAISLNNRNVEAYARLADLYTKAGNSEKAKQTYEAMMSLSPNDPNVYLVLGQYNLKAKKYGEALNLLEKSDNLKHSASASEGIAIAAFNMNRLDKARDAAKNAVMMDAANSWESRNVLVKILMQDRNYTAAQEHLEYIIKKDQYNVDYLSQLATCYDQTNQKDKLAELDRKIVNMSRTNVDSRLRLARYADTKNDVETAMSMYKDLTQLAPKLPEVFRRLFELSMKKGNKSDAVSYMRRYIDLSPSDAEAQKDLGDILYEQKDYDGALGAYRAALKINPGIKGFYKKYADIVIAKGQTDEVITALGGVIKSGEADLGTYTTLGMIYQKKKNYSKAIEMYQKALQLDPQNMDALTAMGSCQAASGNIDEAIVTYEQAVMMNQGATTEYKELGDLYARQRNTEEAMKAYKKYLDKVPSDLAAAGQVGRFSYERKQWQDVVKYLGLIKGKDPETDVMYAEGCFRGNNFQEAESILESVKQRKSKNLRAALKLLAETYEKDGKEAQAARAYGEYVALPGVRDSDAAYKHAFMLEKSSMASALKAYDDNVKDYPGDYRSFLRLGLLLSDKPDNLQKSMAMLKRTTELADSVPTVWLELAKVYGKLGKENDELAAYRQYIEKDPQSLDANKRIGMILIKRGQISEGMVNLEMANTMSPNDPAIMTTLATGYVKTGRINEAIDLLSKAKQYKKDDPEIRFQLYELYMKNNQKDKAAAEIKDLVEMKRDPKYLLLFAQVSFVQNKLKDAENAVEDVLATSGENMDALMLKAKIQRAKKKYDDAIETYKEISYLNPEHAPSLFERAETYMAMSKPQWAETFYKRALRADPKFALAELGLAKLSKLKKDDAGYREHLETAKRMDPGNDQINDEYQKLR